MGTEASAGRGLVVVGRGYWNIKGLGYFVVFFGLNYICFMRLCRYHSRPKVVSLWYHSRKEDFVGKTTICRTYRYPSGELRGKVLAAVKERGFRSEQAFLIAACEHELREGYNTEATAQLEARIAATLANMAKEVQSLFTLGHTQFALTNSLLQYVLTCMVEPPEEVLAAARARAKLRYAKILRLAAEEVATRNKATLEEVLTGGKQQ